ncbi:MAG: endolytic transglycosylase MltG [Christensenellales bacterium]
MSGIYHSPESEEHKVLSAVWRFFRPVLAFLISCLIVAAVVLIGVDWAKGRYLDPVSSVEEETVLLVEIPRGSSVSSIGKILKNNGLIRNARVFSVYVQIRGYGSKMKAGTYILSTSMTLDTLMEKLSTGAGSSSVTKFLVVEGMTVEDMAVSLKEQGVIDSVSDFLSLCREPDTFRYNTLLGQVEEGVLASRTYALEGYLFPATYEIYVGSKPSVLIDRMLSKCKEIMSQARMDRAANMGMTPDQVIILASILEKEALPADFAKVSAVFHNRIDAGMRLQSDVTVKYVLRTDKIVLTAADIATVSPYNTYLVDGLPAGPICNPSEKAIDAVLYPDPEMRDGGYLYFVSTDPASGELEFNKTLAEHQAAVEKYRPLWEAYDARKAQGEGN